MKIKLLIFLGLALVGIHGMSAAADVPAMDGWTDALDVAIGKHEEYVAVREARIEALRQQLVQAGSETPEFFHVMIFQIQLGIGAQPIISVHAYCLVLQFG